MNLRKFVLGYVKPLGRQQSTWGVIAILFLGLAMVVWLLYGPTPLAGVTTYALLVCAAVSAIKGSLVEDYAMTLKSWKRQGRCIYCGYNLQETPKQCPECGRVVRHPKNV